MDSLFPFNYLFQPFLLIKYQIRPKIQNTTPNCLSIIPQDNTNLLCVSDEIKVDQNKVVTVSDVFIRKKYNLGENPKLDVEDKFKEVADIPVLLSEYQEEVIPYITGQVGRLIAWELECDDCAEALESKTSLTTSSLNKMKDKGGLFKPSFDVVIICKET